MGDKPEQTPRSLYDTLKPIQEKKGYFFNPDLENMTLPLLENLLVTRARYGYMACPCRLANGERDLDKDIICPCLYREPDVREFGACYCGLYLSKEWLDSGREAPIVPERRPSSNIKLLD